MSDWQRNSSKAEDQRWLLESSMEKIFHKWKGRKKVQYKLVKASRFLRHGSINNVQHKRLVNVLHSNQLFFSEFLSGWSSAQYQPTATTNIMHRTLFADTLYLPWLLSVLPYVWYFIYADLTLIFHYPVKKAKISDDERHIYLLCRCNCGDPWNLSGCWRLCHMFRTWKLVCY